jgi:hypothetical protein
MIQRFDSLFLQVNDLDNIPAFRVQLVLMIFQNLYRLRDSLDDWGKDHFENAINSLALNVDSMRQPTNAWLRLCLIDLEKALTPKEERNDCYFRPGAGADAADRSYEQLVATLDSIGRKVGLPLDWRSEKQNRTT